MKELINKQFGDEDKNEVLNLYEKYKLARDKEIPMFGNSFYTPNIWRWFEKNFINSSCKVESNGVFEDSERRMISFNNVYNTSFPMKLLKIENTSKFNELTHKDFLGGILALGIERNKIGDLLVEDNVCYVPIHEDIESFLIFNIDKIGKSSCKIEILEKYDYLPQFNFKEEVILVSSLRIDGIVSKLANVSRGKAQMMIDQGKVLVDYVKIRDKSYEPKEDERITIRGVGKFILGTIVGSSKSGRLKVSIKKYT
ncbi:RNA-binding protein [Clostridium butyricum]|uniref:YlmH family RNA-binding protein n=1 Tax=Clostridium butyricum TaxID=1492 RepID=UPI00168A4A24|nr:YlmH/Sll1252 family protein [Clostridium butyricum]MDB2151238.1 YlmH/Sll1252 family protein [Clostridium butyricum]